MLTIKAAHIINNKVRQQKLQKGALILIATTASAFNTARCKPSFLFIDGINDLLLLSFKQDTRTVFLNNIIQVRKE